MCEGKTVDEKEEEEREGKLRTDRSLVERKDRREKEINKRGATDRETVRYWRKKVGSRGLKRTRRENDRCVRTERRIVGRSDE